MLWKSYFLEIPMIFDYCNELYCLEHCITSKLSVLWFTAQKTFSNYIYGTKYICPLIGILQYSIICCDLFVVGNIICCGWQV